MVARPRFWLGAHMPTWLYSPQFAGVDLFVSDRRLKPRISDYPPAMTDWALDSGGFTELSKFHEWTVSPTDYASRALRYQQTLGRMVWAAPQDWMCEPVILRKTGKTVADHQRLTIENYLDLKTLWPDGPFVPVLQGWTVADYLDHVDQYSAFGVDLEAEQLVGLGSVCRREATDEIHELVHQLQPIRLHGFGMKRGGLAKVARIIQSSDSMAWSVAGLNRGHPECRAAKTCANCPHYAMEWRSEVLAEVDEAVHRPYQLPVIRRGLSKGGSNVVGGKRMDPDRGSVLRVDTGPVGDTPHGSMDGVSDPDPESEMT